MPPKAAPRRAPARTRPQQQPQPQTEPGANPPPPTTGTSQQNASESRAGTPASSMPTDTPGPNSAGPSNRPGVQRLQSLKKRPTPSGSIAASATRPPPLKGEAPPKPTLKYQPRAVGRRSKEEREAVEKLEAERHRERLAEAAQRQRGRGRGGPMQPRGRGGGGMFRGRGGPMGGRGRGGRFSDNSRQGSMSRRSGTRSIIDRGSRGAEQDGGISSDESDAGIRVSIDHINIESDSDLDDEEDIKGKVPVKHMARGREKGLRPIRLERHEHEERVVSVNMESSSKKSAELRDQAQQDQDNALFVDEETATTTNRDDDNALFVDEGTATTTNQDDDNSLFVDEGTATAAKEEEKSHIKPEPKDDDETMMDAIPHADDDSTITDVGLPEQSVKVRTRLNTQEREEERLRSGPRPQGPETKLAKLRSLQRTKEDIEEFDRHAQDLETVKELLSAETTSKKKPTATDELPTTATTEEKPADDTDAAAEEELNKDKLAGQLFLLQFPPMTPNLVVPGGGPEGGGGSTETTATATAATGEYSQTVTQQQQPVKREEENGEGGREGAIIQTDQEQQPQPQVVTATDRHLQAGRVGKLNVHASGRVTLDWGGIDFELDRATAVQFLQEALIVSGEGPDEEDRKEKEKEYEEDEKRVWAMGQLSGKFTVTPNWERML